MRGHSIADGTKWFDEQKIDRKHYRVDFVPHSDSKWATIFVVGQDGIFGELTQGEHNELTQGIYTKHEPVTFSFNFKQWRLSRQVPGAKEHLKDVVQKLKVTDAKKREKIQKELDGTFAGDYLTGYFETTASDTRGIWFIDYNRLLGDIPAVKPAAKPAKDALVSGRTGSPGKVTGTVRIVQADDLQKTALKATEILVCKMTTPDYVPLMQQAAGIVTDLGGILSHAAIIARELKKPCVTGTKTATTTLKDGQKITLDATKGVVKAA
jgi:phosphohistidine swiveling domain-containing protein